MIPELQKQAGKRLRAVCLLAVAVCLLTSCGYPGDILPPALNIPLRVTDVSAIERGDKIEVSFTVPARTTENLDLAKATPDLRIGLPPDSASPVPSWAPGLTSVRVEEKPAGPVTIPIDAAPYAGKTVVIVVRLAGNKGRWSEWSTPVQLNVVTPLRTPTPVQAKAVAPQGVLVTWPDVGSGITYRLFRQGPGESDPVPLATPNEPQYLDATARYDVAYQYTVQAVHDKAESLLSPPKIITPKDTFAPAVPTGVTALAGINTIEINWERNTDPDFAEFRVYRTDESGMKTRIADKVLTPVYTDRQLPSGKRFRYTVTAVDRNNNESDPSAEAVAVAP